MKARPVTLFLTFSAETCFSDFFKEYFFSVEVVLLPKSRIVFPETSASRCLQESAIALDTKRSDICRGTARCEQDVSSRCNSTKGRRNMLHHRGRTSLFQFQGVYKSLQIGAPKKWINDITSIYYAIIEVDCCLDLSYFKR